MIRANLRMLRVESQNPDTPNYRQAAGLMQQNPDPSTLDGRINTLDIKNMTKAVSMHRREFNSDVLKAAHDYCKEGIRRIKTGRIFSEQPIDIHRVQRMLPHFWNYAAEFSHALWKTTDDPDHLQIALTEIDSATKEGMEDDLKGKMITLSLKALIQREMHNHTGDPNPLCDRVDTHLDLLELPVVIRKKQAIKLVTAKDALYLAQAIQGPEALDYARLAYALFSTHDKPHHKKLFEAAKVICTYCPLEEKDGMELRRLDHLKSFLRSLSQTDPAQIAVYMPVLIGITKDLEEAGYDVTFDTGLLLHEILDPSDYTISGYLTDAAKYLLRSFRMVDEEEGIHRLEKTIEVCEDLASTIEPRCRGFIEVSCGHAHLVLRDYDFSHHESAIECFERARRAFMDYASEETLSGLEYTENTLRKMRKKPKKKDNLKRGPRPCKAYSRRQNKLTTEMMEFAF
ncbi:hypothetical protein KY329_00655 [Candidatus Woesearchaeota archaeon]|nr:hypothetical protein [Candidatus Woesearchaeota archaeon]